jgi:hypothetical protein
VEYKTPEDRVREESRDYLRSLVRPTIALVIAVVGVALGFLADRLNSASLVIIAFVLFAGTWIAVMIWVLKAWGRFIRNLFRRYGE